MTPEAKLKKEISKYLDSIGALWIKPMSFGYGKSGVHDFIVCYKSLFISIEAKVKPNKLTVLQSKFASDVQEADGIVVIAYSVDDVRLAITQTDSLWASR
jgi:hypothetical protein